MELRHLRYFVAIAEEGSFSIAAERRLHTAQPSLSRQIRDLEYEVGAQLFVRSARGAELTDAGRVFLDHARLVLSQVEVGIQAARKAARPQKPGFTVGFLMGQEMTWLSKATEWLGAELRNIEMTVSSELSPELADGLSTGRLDVAFLRAEPGRPDLDYIPVAMEPFLVVLPSDHRLAAKDKIDVRELVDETFIGGSELSGLMRRTIEEYLAANGLNIEPSHRVHNLTMAMSLVASTRGVALLPAYAEKLTPWSVTCRPLVGTPPTIELMVGFRKSNTSPTLQHFLRNLERLSR